VRQHPHVRHDRKPQPGASSGIGLYEVAKQRRACQSRYRMRNKRGERAVPLPVVMKVEAAE
jgi:tRNA (guanosine-2'-O-)-methyltransferase